MRKVILVLLLWSCESPTTQGPVGLPSGWETIVKYEWGFAQSVLVCIGYREAVDVSPESFRWEVLSSQFYCGNEYTSGCFSPDEELIRFYEKHSFVIKHEAGHAIVWKLNKRPLWKCYGHPEKDWCPDKLKNWEKYCSGG